MSADLRAQVILSDEGWRLIDKAIATFGVPHRFKKTAEEATELTLELMHWEDDRPDAEEGIVREMGNLWVLLYQLREIFGHERVDASITATFEKLKGKIAEKESHAEVSIEDPQADKVENAA